MIEDKLQVTPSTLVLGSSLGAARSSILLLYPQQKQNIKPCVQQHVRQFGCVDFSKMQGKNRQKI